MTRSTYFWCFPFGDSSFRLGFGIAIPRMCLLKYRINKVSQVKQSSKIDSYAMRYVLHGKCLCPYLSLFPFPIRGICVRISHFRGKYNQTSKIIQSKCGICKQSRCCGFQEWRLLLLLLWRHDDAIVGVVNERGSNIFMIEIHGAIRLSSTKDHIPTCIIIYFVPNLKHRRWEFQYLVSCFHFRERMKLVGLFQNISIF